MKCYQAILFQFRPDYSVFTFYAKSTPLWSQQISFLSDHEQESIKLEATREARMLQGPIRGRKISAKLPNRCRGARVTVRLGMFQAKETWISSGRLGLWLVCVFTFLPFLT